MNLPTPEQLSEHKKPGALPGGKLSDSYNAVHLWLNRVDGKPQHCERCGEVGTQTGRRWSIEHALKPGKKYERNLDNFDALCKSCHRKQDYVENSMQENFQKGWVKRKERGLDVPRGQDGRWQKAYV